MARLYSEQGDAKRAAEVLNAIPVDDRTSRIEFALGASYDQLKKNKEAIAAYRRALDLDPDNLDTERGLANALLADGQLDEALKVLNGIVAAEPQDAQSQIRISEIQRRQGHYDEALKTLEKAKPLAPDSLELTYNEALIYDSLGRYDDAISVLTKLVSDSTAHADGKYSDGEKANRSIFLDRLAIIYREQNKTTEAVATYKKLIALGGDYVKSGYSGPGRCLSRRAPVEGSDRCCCRSCQGAAQGSRCPVDVCRTTRGYRPGGAGNRSGQGAACRHNGHARRARLASRAGDHLHPAEALAGRLDGVECRRGAGHQARREALRLLPARLALRPPEAVRRGGGGVPQGPRDRSRRIATILNYLGYMLADRGVRLPEALTMIRKAVELDPQNDAFLDSLGWVYYKSGQYALAEENLRKANERINTDPTIHDHLGEVYEKTGNLKLAVAQWERSMTEYARSLPADADPADVAKVQHKLENARVKLAKVRQANSLTIPSNGSLSFASAVTLKSDYGNRSPSMRGHRRCGRSSSDPRLSCAVPSFAHSLPA